MGNDIKAERDLMLGGLENVKLRTDRRLQCLGIKDDEREFLKGTTGGLVNAVQFLDEFFIAPCAATEPGTAAAGYKALSMLMIFAELAIGMGAHIVGRAEHRVQQSKRGKLSGKARKPSWTDLAAKLSREVRSEGARLSHPKMAQEIRDRMKLRGIRPPAVDTLARWLRE